MRIKSVFKHSAQALAEGAIVASLVVGLMAGTALAGKPSSGAGASALRVDDGTYAGTTTAYQGANGAIWVHAMCYQNGGLVYEEWRTYSEGTAILKLGPTPNWSSGAADCAADEGYFARNNRFRVVGSTTFTTTAN